MPIDERIDYIATKYGTTLGIVEDLAQDMRLLLLKGENPKYLERRVIDILRSRRYNYTSVYYILYGMTDMLPFDDNIIDKVALDVYLESLSGTDKVVMEYRLSGYTCQEIGKLIGRTHSWVSKRLAKLSSGSLSFESIPK